MFFSVSLANLLLPDYWAHIAQILILSFSVLINPFIQWYYLDGILKKIFFATVTIIWKVLDWNAVMDLLYRAHVLFSTHNLYYWMLNYFHFGVLGSWPILR